jgi:acyl-CoA thioesterase-2
VADQQALGDQPLRDLLTFQQTDERRFVADSPAWARAGDRRFGGVGLAQMLRAAMLTVGADRAPHAMHAFFVGMGDGDLPMDLVVEEVYEGGSFSIRQVTGAQAGTTRCVATVSFTRERDGGEYAAPIRHDAPGPTPEVAALGLGFSLLSRKHIATPFEVIEVPTDALAPAGPYRTTRLLWVRSREPLDGDPGLQACALAYASDFGATIAARAVVGATIETPGRFASLNHTLWLHRTPRMDRWNLIDFRPVSAAHSRGLVTAYFHTDDDVHVATMTQEAMMRVAPPPAPPSPSAPHERRPGPASQSQPRPARPATDTVVT